MSALDVLTRQVGPLPFGAWLLVGVGGLWIARTRDAAEPAPAAARPTGDTLEVEDDAPAIWNPIVYVPNLPTPAPAAPTTPAPAVPVPRPPVRPAPSSNTPQRTRQLHTVAPGDTLSKLGLRYGVPWLVIYERNRELIERTARAHGRKDSGGGHWIYPGTVLVIRP